MSDERNTKKALLAILVVALITLLAVAGIYFLLTRIVLPSSYSAIEGGIEKLKYQNLKPGSILTFGHYEQDGQIDNGTEPIEWVVLEKNEDQFLLISQYVLDARPYHETNSSVTWETCSLRTWLNDTFLNAAFTEDEQSCILPTKLDNSGTVNTIWSSQGGNDTEDHVFVLSYVDAFQYFETEKERTCKPTEYSRPNTFYLSGVSYWWLRSPGFSQSDAEYVNTNGSILQTNVNDRMGGVRPAVWISYSAVQAMNGKDGAGK